jgi:hypothetical protein
VGRTRSGITMNYILGAHFIYLSSICLFVCLVGWLVCLLVLFVCLSVCLSIYLFVCLSIYLSACLFVYLSIDLSIYPSIHPSYLSIYLSIHPFVYLHQFPFIPLFYMAQIIIEIPTMSWPHGHRATEIFAGPLWRIRISWFVSARARWPRWVLPRSPGIKNRDFDRDL